MPTLELTENEARVFVRALEVVCDCLDRVEAKGEPIREEYAFTGGVLVHVDPNEGSLLDIVELSSDEIEAFRSNNCQRLPIGDKVPCQSLSTKKKMTS